MTSHIPMSSGKVFVGVTATARRAINRKKILLVSSSGGHWIQMDRLKGAFANNELHFACTERDYAQSVSDGKFNYVPGASKASSVCRILFQAFWIFLLVLRLRPEVVVSTGAAPGYFAILFAKKLGAKTIWVDSIANVDQISLSGSKAARHADLFLTQWEHLVGDGGPLFFGSIL